MPSNISAVHPQDTVEARWGLRFHNYFHTGTDSFTAAVPEGGGAAAFVPRTRCALLSSPHALILVFRGSEPTNLINLRSSGRQEPGLLDTSYLYLGLKEVSYRSWACSYITCRCGL